MGSDVAVGHVMPKCAMSGLDIDIVRGLFERTWGGCGLAVLERKGTRGEDRRKLIAVLEKLEIETMRI